MKDIIKIMEGSVVVSCQALPHEPLYCEEKSIMGYMANAAKQAGSKMIRTSSVRDVLAIKEQTGLPVIGLIKEKYEDSDVFITPTMKEIDELVLAGSDIIALDCTFSKRTEFDTINDFIKAIKEKYPEAVLMADISTYEEAVNAEKCGVDIVGTTMNGYNQQSIELNISNEELVSKLSRDLSIPVIAEGKVHTPMQAVKMLELGAFAVVVGGAITRPLEIATKFFDALENNNK